MIINMKIMKSQAFLLMLSMLFVANMQGQNKGGKLYKDLAEGMSKKEARATIKENREEYISIDIGNGFEWTLRQTGLLFDKQYLTGIQLWPKGSLLTGLGYDGTVAMLDRSRRFFEERGYKVLLENPYWNAPANFNRKGYLYGLVLTDSSEERVVHLFPSEVTMDGKTFNEQAYMYLYTKGMWDRIMKEREEKKERDTAETDF